MVVSVVGQKRLIRLLRCVAEIQLYELVLVGAQADAFLAARLGVNGAGHCVLDQDIVLVSFYDDSGRESGHAPAPEGRRTATAGA